MNLLMTVLLGILIMPVFPRTVEEQLGVIKWRLRKLERFTDSLNSQVHAHEVYIGSDLANYRPEMYRAKEETERKLKEAQSKLSELSSTDIVDLLKTHSVSGLLALILFWERLKKTFLAAITKLIRKTESEIQDEQKPQYPTPR